MIKQSTIKAVCVLYGNQNVSVGSITYTFDIVQTHELGVSIVYYIMTIFPVLATVQLLWELSKEKTNLMPLILFNAEHVSAVNTTIFRSLRLIGCYFMGCIWFGVCWRSVSVWLWWCGIFMQSEALLQTDTERQHTPKQIQPMK